MDKVMLAQYGVEKVSTQFVNEVEHIKLTVTHRTTAIATVKGVNGSKDLTVTWTEYGEAFKGLVVEDLEKLIIEMDADSDAPIWEFVDSPEVALMGLAYLLYDLSEMFQWLSDGYHHAERTTDSTFLVGHLGSKWWSNPNTQPPNEFVVHELQEAEVDNRISELSSDFVSGFFYTSNFGYQNLNFKEYSQLYGD